MFSKVRMVCRHTSVPRPGALREARFHDIGVTGTGYYEAPKLREILGAVATNSISGTNGPRGQKGSDESVNAWRTRDCSWARV